jgi:hypothetical protein
VWTRGGLDFMAARPSVERGPWEEKVLWLAVGVSAGCGA